MAGFGRIRRMLAIPGRDAGVEEYVRQFRTYTAWADEANQHGDHDDAWFYSIEARNLRADWIMIGPRVPGGYWPDGGGPYIPQNEEEAARAVQFDQALAQHGGNKVYTARNGAKYIKLANGQCRFVKGASKKYMKKIRKMRR